MNCTCIPGSKALCDSCLHYDQWITMSDEQWSEYCQLDYEVPEDICEICFRANDNKNLTICTSCEVTVFNANQEAETLMFKPSQHAGEFLSKEISNLVAFPPLFPKLQKTNKPMVTRSSCLRLVKRWQKK